MSRWNPLDLAAGGVSVVFLVVGYGAWALFRTPTPIIAGLEPAVITQVAQRVTITGKDLRPYLKGRIGEALVPVSVTSPAKGLLDVPALPIGVYDVVLFDEAREVARLPRGLAVMPPTEAPRVLSGPRFIEVSRDMVRLLGDPVELVVVKDRAAHTCWLFRRATSGLPESMGQVPCDPL